MQFQLFTFSKMSLIIEKNAFKFLSFSGSSVIKKKLSCSKLDWSFYFGGENLVAQFLLRQK